MSMEQRRLTALSMGQERHNSSQTKVTEHSNVKVATANTCTMMAFVVFFAQAERSSCATMEAATIVVADRCS